MKKILKFCIFSAIIILMGLTANAADNIKPLSDIGIFENGVISEQKVTVSSLCRITSKLMSKEDVAPITEDDPYSGYTAVMKDSGIIDSEMQLSEYAAGETAAKMILFALGYNNAAAQSGKSYTAFAAGLGLTGGTGITASEEVTYGSLSNLVINAITKPLPVITISADGGYTIDTSKDNGTILSKVYEISVYNATVTSVETTGKMLTARITNNVYDSNKVFLPSGAVETFTVSSSVNPYEIENAPCTIWVCDKKVMHAYLKNTAEIRFGIIASVNGDKNKDALYSSSAVARLMFYDDKKEYKTQDDFEMKYNCEKLDNYAPAKIVGKYARAVFDSGKLVHIDAWDFQNGGLIKSIDENYIYYVNKANSNAKFNYSQKYDFIRVISNGSYTDISQLKKGSVFSWLEYENGIIIAVNEQVISAKFESISDDYITLGNIGYLRGDTIYTSKDGRVFFDSYDNLFKFVGNDVSAYFNIKNEIVYILPAKNSEFSQNTFLGFVTGYISDSFDETAQIEILPLEGTLIRKGYTIKDKANYEDGLSFNIIKAAVDSNDTTAIYEFEINADGKVSKIKKAAEYKGLSSSVVTLDRLSTDTSYSTITASDGTVLYLYDTPIVIVYKDKNGSYCAAKETWSNLYGRNASGSKAMIFGYENTTDPRAVIITGKTENISLYETRYGVITDKSLAVSEDGEKIYKITLLSNQSEAEYTIPYDEGKDLPELSYVTYKISYRYDQTRTVKLLSSVDLTGSFDTWELTGFNYEPVTMTGSYSFMTSSGKTRFLHPYYCFVAVLENGKITKGDMSDISIGDQIYYYYTGGDTRIIFKEK